MRAFFDSVKSLRTIRDVDASFSAALDQVRGAGGVAGKPLVVVLGGRGDGSVLALWDLFAKQAARSTNGRTVVSSSGRYAAGRPWPPTALNILGLR